MKQAAKGEIPSVSDNGVSSGSEVVKLEPRARVVGDTSEAIPMISLKDIGPFLARPLVVEDDELDKAPVLVGTYEQRKLLGTDDIAYAKGYAQGQG